MFACENSVEYITCFLVLLVTILFCIKFVCIYTLGISKSSTCLVGKTVLITGGNSGLGYETALALAGRGARIIIADKDDATITINKIIKTTNNKNISYKHLDLKSLTSVRGFAKEINMNENRLDILINNAGQFGFPNQYTGDGLLLAMQVNFFGHFLLTHLLIDLLKKSAPSRIIFLSSIAAFLNNISLDTLNKPAKFLTHLPSVVWTYGNTKVMTIVASNIFAEKLINSGVTSNSLHPGLVNTRIWSTLSVCSSYFFLKHLIYDGLLRIVGKTPWEGAQTQIECALSKNIENITGKYFMDCKTVPQPWRIWDKKLCESLWEKSEELVKLEEREKL